MAWLKIDDNAPLHRKILAVPPAARWLWICGLAYCQRLRTDGHVPTFAVSTFGLRPADKPATLAHRLVLAGLWHVVEGGWHVHDFLEWNESANERDEKSAEKGARQQKWRAKKQAETRLQVNAVDASTADAADATPHHTTPPPPAASAGAARPRGGVITSSAQFVRLLEHNAFVGARLRVPHKLHSDFVAALGGVEPDARLRAWYAELDIEIELSGEPIVPDIWKWLTKRFTPWASTTAGDAEIAKFLEEA